MLIKCPECEQTVSDKAYSCPHCGYPISSTPAPLQAKTRRPRKFRRLPNGFGSIKHLSGNRRNPYAAYPPTKEWTKTSPKSRPAVGYFKTYNEAYSALVEYNKNGIDIETKLITFAQIFNIFMEEHKQKNPSPQSISAYNNAFLRCEELHNRSFVELRKSDFQKIFDDNQMFSKATTSNIKILLNQLYKVAIENDIVDRNYAANITPGGKATEKGVPFTAKEIELLWQHVDDDRVKPALVMIYCGYRVGELKKITIEGNKAIGGLKTKSGKGRTVPIHSAVLPFVHCIDNMKSHYLETFKAVLAELGISHAKTGELHTCHDCRHTFSWLADKYKMDSLSKRIIMGHSLGSDVEDNTYGHRTFEELQAEIEKIKAPVLYNK